MVRGIHKSLLYKAEKNAGLFDHLTRIAALQYQCKGIRRFSRKNTSNMYFNKMKSYTSKTNKYTRLYKGTYESHISDNSMIENFNLRYNRYKTLRYISGNE